MYDPIYIWYVLQVLQNDKAMKTDNTEDDDRVTLEDRRSLEKSEKKGCCS